MKEKTVAGFRCYLCGKDFQNKTQQATPCGYGRFGRAVCKDCCEACNSLEPFPCPDYNRRKRREQRREKRHDVG